MVKLVVVYFIKMFFVFKEIVECVLLIIGGNDNIFLIDYSEIGNWVFREKN